LRFGFEQIELNNGLRPVSVAHGQDGLAVLLRLDGDPVHFFMRRLEGPAELMTDEVRLHADQEAAREVLRERIRRELADPVAPLPFSLTIAVCTRERVSDLRDCLESVLALPPRTAGPLDILVVDNASPSGSTRELVSGLTSVRYVYEPRPGLDFARNRALRESRSDFVAFVDDDARVDPAWLVALETAVSEQLDATVVTGLVLPQELETEAQILFENHGGFRRGFQKIRFAGDHIPQLPLYPVAAGSFGAGCNMVVRREEILRLGGFDEALDTGPPLPGGGDLDIFYRVARAGLPLVYEPRMLVYHRHRRQMPALRHQYWTWGTGLMAFVAKNYRADERDRRAFRRLVRWWARDGLHRLWSGMRGRGTLPPALVAAELAGGLIGLAGTYRRSVKRTRRIRDRLS
jgi:glycosyltransferase involved in cell wall biosynthesis